MSTTPNLFLPRILAGQAQKHVTHNEALRSLDGLVQLSVKDRTRNTPPASPEDGARYIVGATPTGPWTGWAGDIALKADGAWHRLPARDGFLAWVEAEGVLLVREGADWVPLVGGAAGQLSRSASGFWTGMETREALVSGLSGSVVDTGLVIPDRAICLGVTTKVVTAIIGAASFSCGTAAQPGKFGAALGVAVGSTNCGVIGPEPVYADTGVRLTAASGAFASGDVRLGLHLLMVSEE
jgi:hypothetical protein